MQPSHCLAPHWLSPDSTPTRTDSLVPPRILPLRHLSLQRPPSPSPLVTLYAARSHLALTPPSPTSALSLLSPLSPTLDTRALTALAHYLAGEKEDAVSELEEVLAETGERGLEEGDEGRMVRGVVGTVWILEGEARREEGVEVLREAIELGQDEEWWVQSLVSGGMELTNTRAA